MAEKGVTESSYTIPNSTVKLKPKTQHNWKMLQSYVDWFKHKANNLIHLIHWTCNIKYVYPKVLHTIFQIT